MSIGRQDRWCRSMDARGRRVAAVACVTLLAASRLWETMTTMRIRRRPRPRPRQRRRLRRRRQRRLQRRAAPDSAGSDTTGVEGATPDETAPDDTAAEPIPATTGEGTPVDVTLTETSIDGLPTELAAGLVDVTVTDETEAAGGRSTSPGSSPVPIRRRSLPAWSPIFEGGPFPDFFLNNAGVVGSSTIALDEGEYIVWIDLASNLDRPSTVDDIITAPLTVGPGEDGAEISDADGTMTATDYAFSVDVTPGESIVTFNNDSPISSTT